MNDEPDPLSSQRTPAGWQPRWGGASQVARAWSDHRTLVGPHDAWLDWLAMTQLNAFMCERWAWAQWRQLWSE